MKNDLSIFFFLFSGIVIPTRIWALTTISMTQLAQTTAVAEGKTRLPTIL